MEELIEAGVPMAGASWEDWLAMAGQVRREMLGMTSEVRDVVVLLIDRPLPRGSAARTRGRQPAFGRRRAGFAPLDRRRFAPLPN